MVDTVAVFYYYSTGCLVIHMMASGSINKSVLLLAPMAHEQGA